MTIFINDVLTVNKITIVIDPSHEDWVLGGMFREIIESAPNCYELEMQVLTPPRDTTSIILWLKTVLLLRKKQFILFTSLTPLENYLKFRIPRRHQKIAFWYTHKMGDFNNSESRALRRANVIFAHSARDFVTLRRFTDAEMIPVVGAIDSRRFLRASAPGSDILWVGTPVERKQPSILFGLADSIPNQQFRLIGRGWKGSVYWKEIVKRINISYVELDEALNSERLDGCSIYLVTSNCEGGPMPLLEAIASGLHPIATDVGFVREIFALAGVSKRFIVEARVESFLKAIESAKVNFLDGRDFRRHAVMGLTMRRMALIFYQNLCKKESDCTHRKKRS